MALPRSVRTVALATALWSLGYGAYRMYYALGGKAGLPGVLRHGAYPAFRSIKASQRHCSWPERWPR